MRGREGPLAPVSMKAAGTENCDSIFCGQEMVTDRWATVSGEMADLLGLEELRLGLLGVRPNSFPDRLVKQDALNGGHRGGGCRGVGREGCGRAQRDVNMPNSDIVSEEGAPSRRPTTFLDLLTGQDPPHSDIALPRWDLHGEHMTIAQTGIAPTTLRSMEATLLQFCRPRETPMPASVPGVQGTGTGPFCSCGVYVETSHEEEEEESTIAEPTKAEWM